MKRIFNFTFSLLCLSLLFVSCNDELAPTSVNDEAITPLSKVIVDEYFFEIVLDDEVPFVLCEGDLMQYHGSVGLYLKEKTTPSGNTIVSGWVDYHAFDGVTLENTFTGAVWTLTNGHNPFGEVIKENGFYVLHYQWHEFYENEEGDKLRVFLKGHVKINPDGTVSIERETVRCF
jgi:hypothetical protein